MQVIYYLDLFGTFIFAVSGVLAAARQRYDLFGVILIAAVTAMGGGTVRELLLGGGQTLFWFRDSAYIIAVLAAVAVTLLYLKRIDELRKWLFYSDAVGLGVFMFIGISRAAASGLSPHISIILGLITAIAGGMMRDLLCQVRPLVLHREFYATAGFCGGLIYYALVTLFPRLPSHYAGFALIVTVIALRLLSLYQNWALPKFFYQETDQND